MRQAGAQSRRTPFLLCAAFAFLLAGSVALVLLLAPKPGTAAYHEREMVRAYAVFRNVELEGDRVSDAWEAVVLHRQALIEIGHFEAQNFPLRDIDTREFSDLGDLLKRETNERPLAHFDWSEDGGNVPSGVTVYATPEELQRWRKMLRRYLAIE